MKYLLSLMAAMLMALVMIPSVAQANYSFGVTGSGAPPACIATTVYDPPSSNYEHVGNAAQWLYNARLFSNWTQTASQYEFSLTGVSPNAACLRNSYYRIGSEQVHIDIEVFDTFRRFSCSFSGYSGAADTILRYDIQNGTHLSANNQAPVTLGCGYY